MDLDTVLDQLAEEQDAPCDVAELALWLARDEYPELDVEAYLSELNGMVREAKTYLAGSLESRVHGLCRYLFHEMGFRGNIQDYYNPGNSYFNEVIDKRTGIPISLSVLTMAVGRRAGLDIVGVGLPGHFVTKAIRNGTDVLFDPFHGGRQLTVTDCENLVTQVTGEPFQATAKDLAPAPLRSIVIRMLSNLKAVYLREGDFRKGARVMKRLSQLSPGDMSNRRDLGISLVYSGAPGQAIDYLSAYLAAAPAGEDTQTVQRVLNQALKAVGAWN
jgi:regulator of sirC expression with transglutaminase-like and TPR domain